MNGTIIHNAADVTLDQNPGSLPNLAQGLYDWFRLIKAIKIAKTVVDYVVIERGIPVAFQGVIQPFSGKQLQMRPEGQRSWDWSTMHTVPTLELEIDDVIWVGNTRYRIMKRRDFTVYGYLEFEMIEAYQDNPTSPPLPNEPSVARFSEDVVITSPLTVSVDVSASISNAFAAVWDLLDLGDGNTPITGAIEILDETHVQITAPKASTYRLLGAS